MYPAASVCPAPLSRTEFGGRPVALALDGREAGREIEDRDAELVGDGDEPLALHLAGRIRPGRARQRGDHGDQTSARGRDLVTQRRKERPREIDVVLALLVRRGVGKRARQRPTPSARTGRPGSRNSSR